MVLDPSALMSGLMSPCPVSTGQSSVACHTLSRHNYCDTQLCSCSTLDLAAPSVTLGWADKVPSQHYCRWHSWLRSVCHTSLNIIMILPLSFNRLLTTKYTQFIYPPITKQHSYHIPMFLVPSPPRSANCPGEVNILIMKQVDSFFSGINMPHIRNSAALDLRLSAAGCCW